MIFTLIHKSIYTLLLSLILYSSCNGQVKNASQENVDHTKTISGELPKMKRSQGKYTHHTASGPHVDTSVFIRAILEDKHGNIWAATMGEGVYRYDGKSFTNYTVKDGLITNLVYSMLEDKNGDIWFGTTNGVSRYNGKLFTNFPFSVIKGNPGYHYTMKTEDPRKDPFNGTTEVWSMLEDNSGKIWLGTTDGIYCYDGENFTSIEDLDTTKNSRLNIKSVTSIAEDKAGNIWFTSWADGLCRFDGKSITKVSPGGEGFQSMLLDKNENFWLGRRANSRDSGVYRYDGKTFTKILSEFGYISEMKEDDHGNIWFSNVTKGGMIYYNPYTSKIISKFTKENGLPHYNIQCVTIDKSGIVWFGMKGMTLSSYDGKTFTSFYSE